MVYFTRAQPVCVLWMYSITGQWHGDMEPFSDEQNIKGGMCVGGNVWHRQMLVNIVELGLLYNAYLFSGHEILSSPQTVAHFHKIICCFPRKHSRNRLNERVSTCIVMVFEITVCHVRMASVHMCLEVGIRFCRTLSKYLFTKERTV